MNFIEQYDFFYSGFATLWFPFFILIFFISFNSYVNAIKAGEIEATDGHLFTAHAGRIISFIAVIVSGVGIIYNLFNYSLVLLKNEYKQVEGYVEDFVPMPSTGHSNESFRVQEVRFEYSDFEVNPGFNNTKSHGGPIDKGKYVRIQYYNGHILRLWTREHDRTAKNDQSTRIEQSKP